MINTANKTTKETNLPCGTRPLSSFVGTWRSIRKTPRILWLVFLLCWLTLNLFSSMRLDEGGIGQFFQVIHQDSPWILLTLAALPLIWFLSRFDVDHLTSTLSKYTPGWTVPRLFFMLIGLTALVLVLGVNFSYHHFTQSLDENLLRFQAVVFGQGNLIARIHGEWQPFHKALHPLFMTSIAGGEYWLSGYRPGAAMITAFFGIFDLASYTNVFLGLGSALLLARIANQIFPQEKNAPILAVLSLVTSAQFLFTAMSLFAMTAHLFFNLLWLHLFLIDRPRAHAAAAAVGFFAVGLHQVVVHPFFILPFMVDLLRRKRWRVFVLYATTGLLAMAFWLNWTPIAMWLQGISAEGNAGLGAVAAQQTAQPFRMALELIQERSITGDLIFWISNVIRFVTWQNLATLLLGLVALVSWRSAPRPIRLLGWSILASLIPYLLLMPFQGRGWGFRYIHVHLGSFALIAVYGWFQLRNHLAPEILLRWRRAIVGLAAFSALVALPLRAVQVDQFLSPFIHSLEYISRMNAQVIFVDRFRIWYGNDLIRNDPFLRNEPKILDPYELSLSDLRRICRDYSVAYVDHQQLAPFGIRESNARAFNHRIEDLGDVRPKLIDAGCIDRTEFRSTSPPSP